MWLVIGSFVAIALALGATGLFDRRRGIVLVARFLIVCWSLAWFGLLGIEHIGGRNLDRFLEESIAGLEAGRMPPLDSDIGSLRVSRFQRVGSG